ncbi:unnamed protein product [Phytophthora fragariaefolia]|uniref:Unnamed protein product n=1 Tax=Phytophthora fragariaefolia TaxID=1490495 RepID=A0A9W7D2N2_9STRA|nr:unnamed protein product [Phytophthora fragariaefolia]
MYIRNTNWVRTVAMVAGTPLRRPAHQLFAAFPVFTVYAQYGGLKTRFIYAHGRTTCVFSKVADTLANFAKDDRTSHHIFSSDHPELIPRWPQILSLGDDDLSTGEMHA